MRGSLPGRAVAAGALVVSLAACGSAGRSDAPATPVDLPGLRVVSLPGGMSPSALSVSGGEVIAAGRSPGEHRTPALAIVSGDGTSPVRLQPKGMYAEVADLVSVAADGSRLVTLGAAHGGAHANFRWTVWAGENAQVIEQPQTFETFGGESAGSLLGITWPSGGPVIAGTWAGRYGLDAAIWLPRGDRWLRQDSAGTPLANSAHTQVAPRTLAADGRDLVLSGSVIDLEGGARQAAAIWTASGRAGPWRLVRLRDPGDRSEALSTRCAGQTCWASGYVDGRLAVWSITGATPTRMSDVPPIAVDDAAPVVRTVLLGERVGVLAGVAGRTELALRDSHGWRVFAGPAGSLIDAVGVGQRIYAAVAPASGPAALWTADAPP